MYKYLNLNPLGREVNDCAVRAIALATNCSWYDTYDKLSYFAKKEAILLDDVEYLNSFLYSNFRLVCDCRHAGLTVGEFIERHQYGTYLITMRGHMTCAIDGTIYDIFDPSDKYIWEAYQV